DMYHTGQIMIMQKALAQKGSGSRYNDDDADEYGSPFGSSSEHDDYY
ncbi:MAG: DinB family protein, partial [Cytophagaceae bacterium]